MKSVLASALMLALFSTGAVAEWSYTENIDVMTDEDTSMAISSAGRNELIAVRCSGTESFDILVGVGEYIGSDGASVTYRFDKDEPVNAGTWTLSTNGIAVFAPASKKEELVEQFKVGNTVVFQVTDYQGSKPTSSFSLAGSSAAIDQLSCMN